jgi:hypothetical protein
MIKTREVRVCNYCGSEVPEDFVKIEDVPYEGNSTLIYRGKEYYFCESDFFTIQCFFNDVERTLGLKADL